MGGGLAGLAAARELGDLDVLLLESEPRLGGRVRPERFGGIPYELGALSVLASTDLPVEVDHAPVGLFWNGALHLAPTPLAAIVSAIPSAVPRALGPEAGPAPEAFFGVIHPCRIDESILERRGDALVRFVVRRTPGGNAAVLARLAEGLRAERRVGARVVRVETRGDSVEVETAGEETLRARSAIVATDGVAAREILRSPSAATGRFLSALRYGSGAVAVLGLRAPVLPRFSYIALPPSESVRAVVRGATAEGVSVVHFYFHVAPDAASLVPAAKETLARISPGAPIDVAFSETKVWPRVGPIVSSGAYGEWNDAILRPSDRIRLAGDYVHFLPYEALPYGQEAALASGRRAAEEIRAILTPSGGTS